MSERVTWTGGMRTLCTAQRTLLTKSVTACISLPITASQSEHMSRSRQILHRHITRWTKPAGALEQPSMPRAQGKPGSMQVLPWASSPAKAKAPGAARDGEIMK